MTYLLTSKKRLCRCKIFIYLSEIGVIVGYEVVQKENGRDH